VAKSKYGETASAPSPITVIMSCKCLIAPERIIKLTLLLRLPPSTVCFFNAKSIEDIAKWGSSHKLFGFSKRIWSSNIITLAPLFTAATASVFNSCKRCLTDCPGLNDKDKLTINLAESDEK